ncbi:MAG: hydroxymethylglutaryl-CoA lyase [Cyclobacteriaceae bacterium]|nr:hydroxymethylglutaryl-CoA lyase [Cyclobacteriaceae bacterium]
MKLIECPRDAMQGLDEFIPTSDKVRYINQLLKVGFDTIDFGSFVSAKAIPQMRDTADLLGQLEWEQSNSRLLAIVANARGAQEAASHKAITYLGFPLSISETFQKRNTNKSIAEALNTLVEIQSICQQSDKKLVTYISMGFGNPYGDPYDVDLVSQFVDILVTLNSDVISLADTVGISSPDLIHHLFSTLTKKYPLQEIGVHLHSNIPQSIEKIEAAYASGCRRFDGALKGFGGCPMAKDDLVGNIATETIIDYMYSVREQMTINPDELRKAIQLADEIFPKG